MEHKLFALSFLAVLICWCFSVSNHYKQINYWKLSFKMEETWAILDLVWENQAVNFKNFEFQTGEKANITAISTKQVPNCVIWLINFWKVASWQLRSRCWQSGSCFGDSYPWISRKTKPILSFMFFQPIRISMRGTKAVDLWHTTFWFENILDWKLWGRNEAGTFGANFIMMWISTKNNFSCIFGAFELSGFPCWT